MTGWSTLLARVGVSWPRRGPARFAIVPPDQSTPRVPREYRALYTYLEHRYASVVVLTFQEIEALLGFALPPAARTEREWWTNAPQAQQHNLAWTGAGRDAAPNLPARTVAFARPI